MTAFRPSGGTAVLLVACVALVPLAAHRVQAVADSDAPKAAGGASKSTFGTKPCGKLVSMEEVEAVFRAKVPLIDIEEQETCVYEGEAGFPLYSVRLTHGPKLRCTTQDGLYLGKPVERVAGIGDQAAWIPSVGTLCFVKGTTRVQLSFDSTLPEGSDAKALATGLARKAVGRLPRNGRP